jgi:hypothetical protein
MQATFEHVPTLPLQEVMRRHRGASEETVERELGSGFLFLNEGQPEDADSANSFSTVASGGLAQVFQREIAQTRVYLLRPPGTDLFMVTIGRTQRSNILLDHGNVSKFHAFFRYDPSLRRFSICDAGSTNGTAVSGTPLMANQLMPLSGGEHILIGRAFEGTYHSASTLAAYLSGLASTV